MADADEDSIRPLIAQHTVDSSDDEDDSGQDFRFLAMLTSSHPGSALPKRGIKDFEPDPSRLQSSTLAASRQAMHDALSHVRVHAPKAHVIGLYDEKTGLTRVDRLKGSMFKSVGRGVPGGAVELLPEEALWALERGSLDVRWPVGSETREEQNVQIGQKITVEFKTKTSPTTLETDTEDDQAADNGEDGGIPMSLQGAYTAFLGEEELRGGSLTLDRYLVYSGLKRSGFIVLRANGFDNHQTVKSEVLARTPRREMPPSLLVWLYGLISRSWNLRSDMERQRLGPLIAPRSYRSYDEIYRLLSIIPSSHHSESTTTSPTTISQDNFHTPGSHPFTTTFNVYKPLPNYRKTTPGMPAFRICVVSARDTLIPTLAQLSDLLNEQPSQGGVKEESGTQSSVQAMYKRLKQDGRNIILAVVDEGVVSYIRMSEAPFPSEYIYERVAGGGGKRGGGNTGGRGRGGGRGGRGGRGRGIV